MSFNDNAKENGLSPENKAIEERGGEKWVAPPGLSHDLHWIIKPITALANMPHSKIEWLWEPYLAARMLNGWAGVPKSGKTTLVTHALAAMSRGDTTFAGHPLTPVKTLIVTQEPLAIWNDRREEHQLSEDMVHFMLTPNGSQQVLTGSHLTFENWRILIARVVEAVKAEGFGLVVFDLINSYWPVRDENDSTPTKDALAELRVIMEAGAAVLGIQHAPKDGRRTARGSNAFEGECDVFVYVEEIAPLDADNHKRRLTRRGRVGGMGHELLDLTDDGYVLLKDDNGVTTHGPRQPDKNERRIMKLIPDEPPGMPASEIASTLGLDHSNLNKVLKEGCTHGWWVRTGGKPFLYSVRATVTNGNGTTTTPPEHAAAKEVKPGPLARAVAWLPEQLPYPRQVSEIKKLAEVAGIPWPLVGRARTKLGIETYTDHKEMREYMRMPS
jgi:hypothetical protein